MRVYLVRRCRAWVRLSCDALPLPLLPLPWPLPRCAAWIAWARSAASLPSWWLLLLLCLGAAALGLALAAAVAAAAVVVAASVLASFLQAFCLHGAREPGCCRALLLPPRSLPGRCVPVCGAAGPGAALLAGAGVPALHRAFLGRCCCVMSPRCRVLAGGGAGSLGAAGILPGPGRCAPL